MTLPTRSESEAAQNSFPLVGWSFDQAQRTPSAATLYRVRSQEQAANWHLLVAETSVECPP